MKYFKFLLVLLFALLLFYEYNSIFESLGDEDLGVVKNSTLHMLSVWLMLTVSYLLFNNHRFIYRTDSLSKRVARLTLYVFFINIVSTLFSSGLPSMSSPALWLLPLFIYWAISVVTVRWRNLNKQVIFFTILLYVLVYAYIVSFNAASLLMLSSSTPLALISSYFCLYVLPLVLCLENKIIKYITIAIVIAVIISSVKRTGAVALTLGIITYLFLQTNPFSSSRKNIKKKLSFIFIIILSVFGIIYLMENSELTVFNRLSELGDDGGSGRDEIYKKVWRMIWNQDPFGFVFGNGYNAVALDSKMGMGAHNDFLEVMYDYGIIGLTFYLSIHITLIKHIVTLSKSNSKYAAPMGMSYAIFLSSSTFSQIIIYSFFMVLFFMSWAFFLSARKLELLLNK